MTPISGIAIGTLVAALLSGGAQAQDYPNRPIRLIVPFGTGGATDSSARAVADRLGQRLGQSIVVENRAGAGGSIGAQYVARSAPDGYTLLLGLDATMVVNPFTQTNVPFNTVNDFIPVTKLGDVGLMLVANPGLPARNVSELLQYSKANPNKLSFSTGGAGSTTHVAGELLKQRTGLDMTHVPYKSGGLAVLDAVSGQVQLSYSAIAGAASFVQAGKLVGIGVSSTRRNPSLPNVPTFIEQGLPDFEAVSWVGILVPAQTPKAIVDKLNSEIVAVLKEPAMRERFAALGIDPVGNSPAEFAAQIKADLVRWQRVVERGNIKAD
jgi:tripartite-type tricarboxylate transporter receptor subunit TctC